METIVVSAAVIVNNQNRFLIAQRKKGTHQESKWEFPGGKIETGEEPKDSLKREILEELGLIVEVGDIFEVISHRYEKVHIILLCYLCRILKGEPRKIECNDFKWVTPQEMLNYDFAAADVPVVNKILNAFS